MSFLPKMNRVNGLNLILCVVFLFIPTQVTNSGFYCFCSVSAERWVHIEEVRPGSPLKEYLMRKKAEGYSVVAAEQTSTSYQLQSFKFPKKTLLLLG